MKKILHITAHLGGGVGKIISGIAIDDRKNEHAILCLEETENKHFEKICLQNHINIYNAKVIDVDILMKKYNIIQIEWWHHPLMTQFLVEKLSKFAIRLVVWSHISGCNYPRTPFKFIKGSTNFVFTTKYSWENPSWKTEELKWIKENVAIVPSVGSRFKQVEILKKKHFGFNVGYVGFLGYEKIHPEFIDFCCTIKDIPNIKFVFVGDMKYGEKLKTDIIKKGIGSLIKFKGYVDNVNEELAKFDIFNYLLQPEHTGSTENALLEAMAQGIPPVVLKQCVEQYIVQDRITGCVVQNKNEYKNAVQWLYRNPQERLKLGGNAADFVRKNFDLTNTIKLYDDIYNKVIQQNRVIHEFDKVFGNTPYEWFVSCYAGDLENIQGMASGDTKASFKQYKKYFPQDKNLQLL